jgi:MOSC domain-containing protein YiiM
VTELECVPGRGVQGDRFFDYKPDYKGQITFFSMEVFESLCTRFGLVQLSPTAVRRNVFTRGVDLNTLFGSTFEVQGIRFEGSEECRPCYWMDQAIAPGAEVVMRGWGGLRARILTAGRLRTGPIEGKPAAAP